MSIDVQPIFSHFERQAESGRRVYGITEIRGELRTLKERSLIPATHGLSTFISLLKEEGKLNVVNFKSKVMRGSQKYCWGEPSIYQLAQSLRPKAYLCHGSAVFLHSLTDDIVKTVFVNVEQSPKPKNKGELSQDSLDRAFAREQRKTTAIYAVRGHQVTMVNGKSTNSLGVEEITDESGAQVRLTGLERTLIDIVVRPAYAGGVAKVLEAYRTARGRVSTDRLLEMLRQLDYSYPYHQAIGFLMDRAGFAAKHLELLSALEIKHDFYLQHGMREKDFDERWRLYVPEGF